MSEFTSLDSNPTPRELFDIAMTFRTHGIDTAYSTSVKWANWEDAIEERERLGDLFERNAEIPELPSPQVSRHILEIGRSGIEAPLLPYIVQLDKDFTPIPNSDAPEDTIVGFKYEVLDIARFSYDGKKVGKFIFGSDMRLLDILDGEIYKSETDFDRVGDFDEKQVEVLVEVAEVLKPHNLGLRRPDWYTDSLI